MASHLETAVNSQPTVAQRLQVTGVYDAAELAGARETVLVVRELCFIGEFTMADKCFPCPIGSFTTHAHAHTCTPCASGLTTASTGSAAATECVPAASQALAATSPEAAAAAPLVPMSSGAHGGASAVASGLAALALAALFA